MFWDKAAASHPAIVCTLYNTKDQMIKASEPSYSNENTTQGYVTTEWSTHNSESEGLPEWQSWEYDPHLSHSHCPICPPANLQYMDDTLQVSCKSGDNYLNNHNTITKAPRQTTWQEHLTKDPETWPLAFVSQPNKVMRTTKEIMKAAGIL